MSTQTEVNISKNLIDSANAYLDTLPKSTEEVIETWIRIGSVVAKQLTESEQQSLLSGSISLKLQSNKN